MNYKQNWREYMSLSWGKLEEILNRGKSSKPPSQETSEEAIEKESHPANILLQIMLPIVLILGFVLFFEYKELKEEVEKICTRPAWENYKKAVLELQKQILIKIWERVKSERRVYFKIDLFLDNELRIKKVVDKFVSHKSIDEDFKDMCGKTCEHLDNKSLQEKEINFLYEDVLQNTLKELREMEKEFPFQDISDENKKFIKKQIEEFIVRIIKEVTTVQHKTIKEIFAYFRDRPDELKDDKLDELIQNYRVAPEKNKKIYAEKIYGRLHEKIEIDLEDQGYYFLEETWQKRKL